MKQPLPKPGPGEARVRIAFAGVNFIDIYLREAFQFPRACLGQLKHSVPSVLIAQGAYSLGARCIVPLGTIGTTYILKNLRSSPHYIPGLEGHEHRNTSPTHPSLGGFYLVFLAGAGVVESTGPGAEVWLGRRVAFVCLGS